MDSLWIHYGFTLSIKIFWFTMDSLFKKDHPMDSGKKLLDRIGWFSQSDQRRNQLFTKSFGLFMPMLNWIPSTQKRICLTKKWPKNIPHKYLKSQTFQIFQKNCRCSPVFPNLFRFKKKCALAIGPLQLAVDTSELSKGTTWAKLPLASV